MLHLVAASILWAFSFGLIKGQLSGLDPVAVACGRLGLAALAFLPFALKERPRGRLLGRTLLLGVVQFGVMYVLYIAAYRWLPAWQVAFFTVFTPLYVVLLADARAGRWAGRHALAAVLAVAGAWVVVYRGLEDPADWRGVVLLQGANLCFAWGQVRYGDLVRRAGIRQTSLLGWMYLGAAAFALVAVGGSLLAGGHPFAGWDVGALAVLAYLGLLPTALGFYLWNRGAARTAPGFLAATNNLKVPLAVLVSWIVFGEQADELRALAGLALVVAGLFAARPPRDEAMIAD